MAKKIIRLTESELIEHIRQVVNEPMNEIDGKTHARVANAVKCEQIHYIGMDEGM